MKNTDSPFLSFTKKHPWIIIPFVLLMGSVLFYQIKGMWMKKKSETEWQERDFKDMVSQCILDSKDIAIKYPELTKEYCSCSIKQIQTKFRKDEYNATLSKTIEEQKSINLPVIQSCLNEYQNKIRAEEGK